MHYKSIIDHFCYDAPINSMHFMKLDKELVLLTEPLPYFYDRSDGKENWMKFYEGLKDFAKDTNFLAFWEAHQDYYKGIVEKLEIMLAAFDIPNELESYFGMSFNSYAFISSPLQEGGYGGGTPNGNPNEASCTIGYELNKQSNWTELGLRDFLWHEFGHGFVNPLVGVYLEQNEISDDVYSIIVNDLNEENKYLYQSAYFQEGIVRAMTHRLTVKYYGQKVGDEIREKYETFGYAYILNLIEALKTYESIRESNNISFDAYLPRLMEDIVKRVKN
jgi:hypothetical protein